MEERIPSCDTERPMGPDPFVTVLVDAVMAMDAVIEEKNSNDRRKFILLMFWLERVLAG